MLERRLSVISALGHSSLSGTQTLSLSASSHSVLLLSVLSPDSSALFPSPRTFANHPAVSYIGRKDVTGFEPACVCGTGFTLDSSNHCTGGNTKMDDWDEYWLDLHSESCKANVHNVMTSRIKAAKAKGCDGMDPDNVDSVSPAASS